MSSKWKLYQKSRKKIGITKRVVGHLTERIRLEKTKKLIE